MGSGGFDPEVQQVAFTGGGGLGQVVECFVHRALVALGLEPFQLGELGVSHFVVIDLQHIDQGVVLRFEGVDADHGLDAGIDPGLGPGGRLLDPQLGDAGRDRSP